MIAINQANQGIESNYNRTMKKENIRYLLRQSTDRSRQKMAADRDSKFCESLLFEELQNSH